MCYFSTAKLDGSFSLYKYRKIIQILKIYSVYLFIYILLVLLPQKVGKYVRKKNTCRLGLSIAFDNEPYRL